MGIDVNVILVAKKTDEPIITGGYLDVPYDDSTRVTLRLVERVMAGRKVWSKLTEDEHRNMERSDKLFMSVLQRNDEISSWLGLRACYDMTFEQAVLLRAIQDEVNEDPCACAPDGPLFTLDELLAFDYESIDASDVLTYNVPTRWRTFKEKFPKWWFEFLETCKKLDIEYIICDIG